MRAPLRIVLVGISVFLAAEVSIHAQSITSLDVPGSFGTAAVGMVTGPYGDALGVHGFLRDAKGRLWDAKGRFITFGAMPSSINDPGAVTGTYADALGGHGFIRDKQGTITTFDLPGSLFTVSSINNAGAVTGWYYDTLFTPHGFIRDKHGTITTFDPPGSLYTTASSINDAGAVTGEYCDALHCHGFIRDAQGTIATFDPPGSLVVVPLSINNSGAVTGWYHDTLGNLGLGSYFKGFIRDAQGSFTTINVTGAEGTFPQSLNEAGAVTGYYSTNIVDQGVCIEGLQLYCHGFIRDAQGTITTFDPQGADSTRSVSINNRGEVTGWYYVPGTDPTGFYYEGDPIHGFIRDAQGTITTIDPRGALVTFPQSINEAGAVTGFYSGALGGGGFIRTSH